jgi:type II secretory pathway component PulC
MKHPFWIVNSTLLIVVVIVATVLYLVQNPMPEPESITAQTRTHRTQEEAVQIDSRKIYENDLFGTYHKEEPVSPFAQAYIPPFPEPPMPHDTPPVVEPQPQFLEPLNITLKGIVVVNNSDIPSSAIIENKQNGQEFNYALGDTIEDARVIRVYPNKIVLLRTNGQQEIIYLNEDDALHDPSYAGVQDWNAVIEKTDTNTYILDPQEFTRRITSLAELIDVLGLVTAYKKGTSIGCRLGKGSDQSFREAIGLKTGDIINTVNSISTANTVDRLKIYKDIVSMQKTGTIIVSVTRKEKTFDITIKLEHLDKNKAASSEKKENSPAISSLGIKKFAPTLKEIEKQERQNMMTFGRTLSSSENNNGK